MAVSLLLLIAAVLAWGTIYETRFGTSAVQRFIYQSWWFQTLLGFLGVNLAIAALGRYPWKRAHAPFLLAHLGIILILLGSIVGGRFGIDGHLIIQEGQAERMLQLPTNVLVVHQPNPGVHQEFTTHFETTAWNHEPHALFRVPLKDRTLTLVVDRYYPDAVVEEEVRDDGSVEQPAVRIVLRHQGEEERVWLFARDPERFGLRWGDLHLLFLEPQTQEQADSLLGRSTATEHPRGVVTIRLADRPQVYTIPVPQRLGEPIRVGDTPYTVTFKDYFPDFAMTEEGLISRSEEPNNPAVGFTLSGPDGSDGHLLFALHPDFPRMHNRPQTIQAEVRYAHAAGASLPPNSIGIVRLPSGRLAAVFTGVSGERRTLEELTADQPVTHPWLGYEMELETVLERAQVIQHFSSRSNDVRSEVLRVTAQDGNAVAQTWLRLRQSAELPVGDEPITVEYRPAQRELPVTIKLLDFRKIDYPGTQMAAGFESDVQLSDSQRGLILMRKISMNNPLKYRGYTFFQSSYVPGPVETTILSVRNDPGTPFVYAGFIVVIAGIVSLFVFRRRAAAARSRRQPARSS